MFAQESVPETTERNHGHVLQPAPLSRKPGLKKWSVWAASVLALIGCSMGVGCRAGRPLAVNEAMLVSYRDMVWAKRAYNLRYGNCERPYGEHYYNGFCAGYADVCNGGDGYVPALPPSAYRTPSFQSPDGAQCVNAWFEGYPAGVEAAKQEKVGNFNNVLVSKMIDTAVSTENNSKRLLPGDVPVTKSNNSQSNPSKVEVAAPPKPGAVSSVLLPTGLEPAQLPPTQDEVWITKLDQPEIPSLNSPNMPPIVTGSGIVRSASAIKVNPTRSASNVSPSEDSSRRTRY